MITNRIRDRLVIPHISAITMSRFFPNARSGELPLTRAALRRDISILIFDGVRFEYKGIIYNPGCLAIMLPTEQCKSRVNAEGATALVGRHVSFACALALPRSYFSKNIA